jgi:hypothetical protein
MRPKKFKKKKKKKKKEKERKSKKKMLYSSPVGIMFGMDLNQSLSF